MSGLGNPRANALHRCKLLQSRDLVASLANETDPDSEPFIWLDTLCCLAKNQAGKKKGIENIYNVYKQTEHVLVLDSGLTSYAADMKDITEHLCHLTLPRS